MKEKGKSSKGNKNLKWTGIAVLFVLILILTMSFAVTPVIAQEVEVRVNAPEYVEEGATFVATIDIEDVTDLNSAQFDLSFDPDVVKISDVNEAKIGGEDISIWWVLNPDKDAVRVIIMMDPGERVSGSGYLAEVEFKVKGEEGEKSELNLSNEKLGGLKEREGLEELQLEDIPANWIDAEIQIGVEEEEEEEEEEVGEEVTPGSPVITAWEPAESVVSNAVGEPRTFNISVNQIATISWQINGTEVQTNESVTEASFTNTSAAIGTWNVSAIAISTTTGLSDTHTWIWSVTATATVTPTPTEVVGEIPPAETEAEGTPTPTVAPRVTPKPTAPPTEKNSTPAATPKPAVPGFEAVFAIAVMLAIAYILQRRGESEGGK